MTEFDRIGTPLGAIMPDPERQYCGYMVGGEWPCMAPAALHMDFGASFGFACSEHAADGKRRCWDYHDVGGPCGIGVWVHGDPSRCELSDELIQKKLMVQETAEAQ